MVDAEAGQTGNGVALHQLFQTDRTFSCILGQDVLWKTKTHRVLATSEKKNKNISAVETTGCENSNLISVSM